MAIVTHLEDGALGHVAHRNARPGRIFPVEGEVRYRWHDLLEPPFAHDAQLAVFGFDLEAAGGECAHEHDGARALRDVDESPHARNDGVAALAEQADVDVAGAVQFRQTEDGEIDAAPFVEVELRGLIHDRFGIGRRAEAEAICRRTANGAGLHSQCETARPLLFSQGADGRGHAHAEVDDPRLLRDQFQHSAALHERTGIQRAVLARLQRLARFDGVFLELDCLALPRADIGRIERFAEGHLVFGFIVSNDHVVDEDARHVDRLQVVMPIDEPTHLRDDDPAGVARSLRHGQQFVVKGFFVRADVAAWVGSRTAQEDAVQREARVKEIVFAPKALVLDPRRLTRSLRCLGAVVDSSTVIARVKLRARVDKGVQAHLRQHTGLAARDGAVEMREHALRQVESIALLGERQVR